MNKAPSATFCRHDYVMSKTSVSVSYESSLCYVIRLCACVTFQCVHLLLGQDERTSVRPQRREVVRESRDLSPLPGAQRRCQVYLDRSNLSVTVLHRVQVRKSRRSASCLLPTLPSLSYTYTSTHLSSPTPHPHPAPILLLKLSVVFAYPMVHLYSFQSNFM